ncbi:MAG: DUF433 domain-containing protein, partial [Planctomycetaceae bacterium]
TGDLKLAGFGGDKRAVPSLRYPVTMILELLASGMSHGEILADYADLEEEDLRACLHYAARISDVKILSRITS